MKTRKSRSDAWHAGLTVDQQDRAWALCSKLGLKQAAGVIAQEFGLSRAPSETALSNWYSDWPLRKAFLDFGSVAEEAKRMIRETPDIGMRSEQIEAVGQAVFAAAAVKLQDADMFATIRKLGQKDRELTLGREKFARESCALFLRWYADERAREIAESDAPTSDKVSRLRKAFFADVDALEKSGAVTVPV